jgi:hypothetical protein
MKTASKTVNAFHIRLTQHWRDRLTEAECETVMQHIWEYLAEKGIKVSSDQIVAKQLPDELSNG